MRPGVVLEASNEPGKVGRVAALAIEGYTAEFRNQATWEESAKVPRIGSDAVAAEPSGVSLVGTRFWILSKLGMLDSEKMRDASGRGPSSIIASSTDAAPSTRA